MTETSATVPDVFARGNRAFISVQPAIVLAVTALGTALFAYELHTAHAKAHHSSSASKSHHYKQKHAPHTATCNTL